MSDRNKYTLITGGSDGIGLELAKLFANDGHNLIIVAKNKEKLESIKANLESNYAIEVKIVSIDFFIDKSWEKVIEFAEERNLVINNLINNVGIGSFGFFNEGEEGFEERLINVNIIALTKLTKYFLNIMIKNKEGGILNVASTAAFVGGPKMAMYYSSKAYVLSLTEALHDEFKDLGIRISCLCPGPVRTSFQQKAGIKKSKKANKYLMSADTVAKEGYIEFLKGKAIIIPGYKNKLLVFLNRFIPRCLSRKIIFMNNK